MAIHSLWSIVLDDPELRLVLEDTELQSSSSSSSSSNIGEEIKVRLTEILTAGRG